MGVPQILVRDEYNPVLHVKPEAKAVLEEMLQLLEEFGPSWYTEDLHDRALAALELK